MDEYKTSKTLIMMVKSREDDRAWLEFSQNYRPYLYSVIKNEGIEHEDNEELTQDVLVKVWKALEDFFYEPERCRFRTCRRAVRKTGSRRQSQARPPLARREWNHS